MSVPGSGDWQRPSFQAGHTASMVHGATSERLVGPLADRIAAGLLASEDTPGHLREPVFAPSVMAWARAEAVCQQLREWLDGQSIEQALTELTTTEEDEERGKTSTRRSSTAKRVTAALDMSRWWEAHAMNLRRTLGLDPASAARVGRDVAARRFMDARPLADALEKIDAQRRAALEAGPASGD
jgi:hypothetical protein